MVEVVSWRSTLEGTESNSWPRPGTDVPATVGICTQCFLFIGSRDHSSRRATIYAPTVTRIELERDPSPTEVDALVDCHRVWSDCTELHAHVSHLATSMNIYDRPTSGNIHTPQKISNGHISATRYPIYFVYGFMVGFSGTADRMAPFLVGSNPR